MGDDRDALPHVAFVLDDALVLQVQKQSVEGARIPAVDDPEGLEFVDGEEVGTLGEGELVDDGDQLGRIVEDCEDRVPHFREFGLRVDESRTCLFERGTWIRN